MRARGQLPAAARGLIAYVLPASAALAPNGPERERGQGTAEPDEADPVGRDSITMKNRRREEEETQVDGDGDARRRGERLRPEPARAPCAPPQPG